jgi:hypothetical protein
MATVRMAKEPSRPYRIVVQGTSLNVNREFLMVAIRVAEMMMQSAARTA